MAEETAVENGRISNFEELVTLTLTLTFDRVILHSSSSTYKPNFIEIEEAICWRTDVRTFETGFIRSTLSKSRPERSIKKPRRDKARVHADHRRCRSATRMWLRGHTHDTVINPKFHRNPFRDFGTRGDELHIFLLPHHLSLASRSVSFCRLFTECHRFFSCRVNGVSDKSRSESTQLARVAYRSTIASQ